MNEELLKEIELFIEYGVPVEEKKAAVDFLRKRSKMPVMLTLLKEYYSSLPHAREEAVSRVCLIEAVQSTFLLGVTTTHHEYLYCVDFDNAVLVGEKEPGIEESDVLLFLVIRTIQTLKSNWVSSVITRILRNTLKRVIKSFALFAQ